jgi:hypothetical protein
MENAISSTPNFTHKTLHYRETVQTQVYVIDSLAPTTTASPVGGTYTSAWFVTLSCADTNSGCAATYFTTDGTMPTNLSLVYTGPILISVNTTLNYFSVDKAGNNEVVKTQTYVIDSIAPTTTASPVGGAYATSQSVILICTDSNTGCAATYYTTNGTTPTTLSPIYTGPITISANTTLKFFSKDKAGNSEAVQTQVYVIDTVAPTTTASPLGGTYLSAQSVTLTCTDTNSGCAATYYTTDGSVPTSASLIYGGPITISANTTLKYFSRDKAGNSEAVQTQTYVIDSMAPTTTASPVGGAYNSTQMLTLTCADANSGCAATYYTTNGTIPTTLSPIYTGPITISANTTLKFFSKDKAGNSEAVQTQVYVIDTVAPTTTVTPGGGGGVYAFFPQSVTLTCTDTNSGCAATYYTTDGSIPTTLSSVYTTAILISANTTLKFFSRDNAGNSEAVQTQVYVIDSVAPTTAASPLGGSYTSAQSVTLTCTDSNSGCTATYYTTNGATPTTLSPVYTTAILISVNTTLKFFSKDMTGNVEAVQTQIYVIDTVAPTTTASPLGGTYLSAQSVTLTCTDTNSGCAVTYYTTDGTTPTTLSAAYIGPITISSNTTLKYFSKDKSGNSEVVQTQVYTVSTNAPVTTASPLGGTYGSAQVVTLTCTDTNTGCASTYYTIDGTNPTTLSPVYTGPLTISSNTTLKYFSKSNAGNLEAVQTQVYVIDTVAPATTASPLGGTYISVQSVTLTCTDSNSGCAATFYTMDGTTPTALSPVYTMPVLISVNTTLKFFSRDKVGNSEVVQTQVYMIDTVAPTTTASPLGGTYLSAQSVTLTCVDTNSGCAATYYTTDGTVPTVASPVYAGPILISANTTLRFFSKDKAGNSETVQTQGYTISTNAPTTKASPLGGIYGSTQMVTLTCTDLNTGCAATYYTTDGTIPNTASSVYTGPITISSNTTLKYFSKSNAGNLETVQTQVYVIDTVVPTTTASPVGGTYGSAQSVTLTCTDSNSGCAATYYTADGTIPTILSPVYSSPISISANTTLKYFSKDKAGNAEAVQSQVYTLLPTATTGSVSSLTTGSADLFGAGNANGNIGTGWFEYGTASAYGTNTIAQAISGSVSTPLHQVINGLLPNTSYHYRFCVQTSGNKICGVDASFMTRSATLGDGGNISMVIPATETRVDGYDLDDLGRAFGSDRSKANWNALADLNNDGIVDGKDLTILAINFGKAQ